MPTEMWIRTRMLALGLGAGIAAAGLCGCMEMKALVLVQPEGHGMISLDSSWSSSGVDRLNKTLDLLAKVGLINRQALAEELGIDPNGLSGADVRALYSKERLAALASEFGAGVRLVRSREINEEGKSGFAALYAFDDVNQLRVGELSTDGSAMAWAFRLSQQGGSRTRLTVTPPAAGSTQGVRRRSVLRDIANRLPSIPAVDRLVLRTCRGARLRVVLQVNGEIEQSNNTLPLVDSGTVQLADFRADDMPGGSAVLRILAMQGPEELAELHQAKIPGVDLQDPTQPMRLEYR